MTAPDYRFLARFVLDGDIIELEGRLTPTGVVAAVLLLGKYSPGARATGGRPMGNGETAADLLRELLREDA